MEMWNKSVSVGVGKGGEAMRHRGNIEMKRKEITFWIKIENPKEEKKQGGKLLLLQAAGFLFQAMSSGTSFVWFAPKCSAVLTMNPSVP